jgi:hypothetical protein
VFTTITGGEKTGSAQSKSTHKQNLEGRLMKNGILIAGMAFGLASGAVALADDAGNTAVEKYSAYETDFDAFGSASVGQQTIDHFSTTRVKHNARLGVGAGMSYFVTRYLGVGADAYSEDLHHSFIDSASANLILRLPLGNSGFAPYAYGGGGHEFDLNYTWFAQAGAGIEYRFTHNVGIFTDARYVVVEKTHNYGVVRAGLRFAF